MYSDIDEIANNIKDILFAERTFLANGQAADALALGEEKGAAIQRFETVLKTPDAGRAVAKLQYHIKEIAEIAKENEAHFLAVSNGVKGLIARLEAVDGSARAGLYNQYGAEVLFSGAVGGYIKKV
jgi:hypothetical protein